MSKQELKEILEDELFELMELEQKYYEMGKDTSILHKQIVKIVARIKELI